MATIYHCATRDSMRTYRRDSSSSTSSHNSPRQRPRLLRSSATEPSITTSNAIRGPLASSNSSQRATDLLSRVAVHSPVEFEHSSGSRTVTHEVEAMVMYREHHEQSPSSSRSILLEDSSSGYYFSFPSFDDWDGGNKDIDKDIGD